MKKQIILAAITLLTSHAVIAQNLSDIKQEIKRDNALYFELFKKKDLAIVDLYTDDGYLLPPNAPAVKGRTALIKDFTDAYADANLQGVKFTTKNLYGAGAGYIAEEGSWQVFGKDGKVMDNGKYLKLWKRTKQGWRIFRDIFNSDKKG